MASRNGRVPAAGHHGSGHIRENAGPMTKPKRTARAPQHVDSDVLPLIKDAEELTPKELEQECAALSEELKKRSWMEHSADQLAKRIPISVFAMGSLAAMA